jgi:alkylation response protein AidB-like acyl-CoA dehydrogenase
MTDQLDRDAVEASTEDPSTTALRHEVRSWLASEWNPDLTVAEWWDRLADAHLAVPTWPEHAFGRGLSRGDAAVVTEEIKAAGALGAPGGLGIMLAGPTIVAHGDEQQRNTYLRPIVTGAEAWCQLFSEPEAGSDLAGLKCRAERDGDVWTVNGQKVWTSGGQIADRGMLLARTDPDVRKHKGISWFAFDMHQDGVDVRPLREMTGRALFNEVFLTDVTARHDDIIGGLNNGWAVANTTLFVERSSLGAGGHGAAGAAASPGTIAGDLDRRAGDFVRVSSSGSGDVMSGGAGNAVLRLARSQAPVADATLRQQLVRLHEMQEIARFANLRMKAARAAGIELTGAEANIAKLSMTRITKLSAELGLALQGPAGQLWKDPAADPIMAELALFAPAVSIYGGTDEVQKNIIGERTLGLPPEPRTDKDVPFRDIGRGPQ